MRAAYAALAAFALTLSGCSGGTVREATSGASPDASAPIAAHIPLRLVVAAGERVEIVNLNDGRAWAVDLGGINHGLVAALARTRASPAGEVALQTSAGTRLIPLDGSKPRSVDGANIRLVLPRAGGGGWGLDGIDLFALTAGGDPAPAGRLPLTAQALEIPQPAGRLVINQDDATWLWDVATGREVRLGTTSCPRVIGASTTKLVSLPCRETIPVVLGVIDARTGSSRQVRLSPWFWTDGWDVNHIVSPDGRGLAVTNGSPRQVSYVDLASGRVRKVLDGTALGWSPDGHWLAVSTASPDQYSLRAGKSHSEIVRLWSPNGQVITAARVTVRTTLDEGSVTGALVP